MLKYSQYLKKSKNENTLKLVSDQFNFQTNSVVDKKIGRETRLPS